MRIAWDYDAGGMAYKVFDEITRKTCFFKDLEDLKENGLERLDYDPDAVINNSAATTRDYWDDMIASMRSGEPTDAYERTLGIVMDSFDPDQQRLELYWAVTSAVDNAGNVLTVPEDNARRHRYRVRLIDMDGEDVDTDDIDLNDDNVHNARIGWFNDALLKQAEDRLLERNHVSRDITFSNYAAL